ncbi:MAG: hypothetical protein AMXMBFR74_09100 [Parvibaculum sp.]|uniref:hypothetical protein n=1 Tax=Parvibaculum sp. TaxID=2024848 RepID=UPI0035B976A9
MTPKAIAFGALVTIVVIATVWFLTSESPSHPAKIIEDGQQHSVVTMRFDAFSSSSFDGITAEISGRLLDIRVGDEEIDAPGVFRMTCKNGSDQSIAMLIPGTEALWSKDSDDFVRGAVSGSDSPASNSETLSPSEFVPVSVLLREGSLLVSVNGSATRMLRTWYEGATVQIDFKIDGQSPARVSVLSPTSDNANREIASTIQACSLMR